eukprot:6163961-Karenia_brevis.AAC.1
MDTTKSDVVTTDALKDALFGQAQKLISSISSKFSALDIFATEMSQFKACLLEQGSALDKIYAADEGLGKAFTMYKTLR